MKELNVTLLFKKETKGTFVYEEPQSDRPVFPVIYLRKTEVGSPPPKAITVTVKAAA